MRSVAMFFGLSLALSLTASAVSQEGNKLPLHMEKGKTYTFEVQVSGLSSAPSGIESREGSAPGSSVGSEPVVPSPGVPSEGSSRSRESGSESSRSAIGASQKGSCTIRYLVTVQDDTTLKVDVQSSDLAGDTGGRARPSGTGTDTAGFQSLGSLTVTIDENGVFQDVQGVESLRAPNAFESALPSSGGRSSQSGSGEAGSSSSSGGEAGSSSTQPGSALGKGMSHAMDFGHVARMQLAFMIGSKLHEKELKEGELIHLGCCEKSATSGGSSESSSTGGLRPSQSGTERPGKSDESSTERPGKSAQQGTERPEKSDDESALGHAGKDWSQMKSGKCPGGQVALRYDGKVRMQGEEHAKFAVLFPRAASSKSSGSATGTESSESRETPESSGTSRDSTESEQRSGRSSGSSLLGGGSAGWRNVGEAHYNFEDGLIQHAVLNIPQECVEKLGQYSQAAGQSSHSGSSQSSSGESSSSSSRSGGSEPSSRPTGGLSESGASASSSAGGIRVSIRRLSDAGTRPFESGSSSESESER